MRRIDKVYLVVVCSTIIPAVLALGAVGAVPSGMNYQGKLLDPHGVPVDSTLSITFEIYADPTAGDALWSETQSVVVVDGLFSVLLGTSSPIPDSIFTGDVRYVSMTIEGDEVLPRQDLVSVGYAFRAAVADYALSGGEADADWTISGDDIYRVEGNIGVGTTSPQAKLAVVAAQGTEALSIVSGSPIGKYHLDIVPFSPSSGVIDYEFRTVNEGGDTNSVLALGQNGKVGIGLTSPEQELHVIGDIQATDRFMCDGKSLGTNKTVGLNVTGGTNLGTWTNPLNPASKGAVLSGDDFLYFTTDWGDNNHFAVCDHMAGIGLGVDGDLYPIKPEITLALRGSTTGFDWISGGSIAVMNNATERVRFASNGRVGIGITSPSEMLDVNGSGEFSGSVTAATYYGDGSNLTGISGTADGDWTIDGNDIYHDPGNVGIGEPNPSFRLHVTSSGSNDGKVLIEGDGNDDDPTVNFYSGPGIQKGAVGWDQSDDRLKMVYGTSISGSNGIVINSSGKVGVYTTDPAARLQVGGSLEATDPPLPPGVSNLSNQGLAVTHGTTTDESSAILGANLNIIGNVRGVTGVVQGLGTVDGSVVGVFGLVQNSDAAVGGASFGVFGRNHSYKQPGDATAAVPAGVFGEAMAPSGIAWGVDAETWSETYEAAGLKAIARHSTGQALGAIIENRSSNGIGLRVSMPDHLNDLGIDCQGRLVTTGGIGVSGPSKDGAREAYAALASEHVIQDMGDSHLSSGAARIDLDEIFLEKVTIDDKNPMRVMVTFYGPHGSYYVERSRTGFDVIEDSGSDAEFSWFVIAKRKGLEDKRLELVDIPQ